jgi:hypothetical protein
LAVAAQVSEKEKQKRERERERERERASEHLFGCFTKSLGRASSEKLDIKI